MNTAPPGHQPLLPYPDDTGDAPTWAALETDLRAALSPLAPPDGFSDRVLAAAQADQTNPQRAKILPWARWRLAVGGALAACLIAGSLATEGLRHRRERERAAAATQQFETAARITDQALAHTREQLARAGVFGKQEPTLRSTP